MSVPKQGVSMRDQGRRVHCKILDEVATPVAADAFCLLEEVGDAVFLDFLQQGVVVARFRMQRGTLEAVRTRLAHDVVEFTSGMVH
jgi:hypothetical protein